jgi:hypothetical protein
MVDSPYWDTGRQRRRASDRLLVDNDGNPRRVTPLYSLAPDHPDFPHGDTGWQYRCRCDICVRLHNERMADWRRRAGLTRPGPYIPKNMRVAQCGTRSGYNKHQRLGETPCAACKKAHSKYQSSWAKGIKLLDPAIEAALRTGM